MCVKYNDTDWELWHLMMFYTIGIWDWIWDSGLLIVQNVQVELKNARA